MSSNLIDNVLAADAFWMVNKTIAKQVGYTAAVLLADLISKRKYFRNRGELQSDGTFFNYASQIETDLGIGQEARITAQKILISRGFLKIIRKGIPSSNYYYLYDEAIAQALDIVITGQTATTVAGQTATVNKNKENKNRGAREASRDLSLERIQEETVEVKGIALPSSSLPEKIGEQEVMDTPVHTFKQIFSSWTSEGKLASRLSHKTGSPKEEIDSLLTTCRENDVPQDQCQEIVFSRLLAPKMPFKHYPEWESQIKAIYKESLDYIYNPVSIIKADSNEDCGLTKTQGLHGQMTPKEYKAQRELADSFPRVNLDKIVAQPRGYLNPLLDPELQRVVTNLELSDQSEDLDLDREGDLSSEEMKSFKAI